MARRIKGVYISGYGLGTRALKSQIPLISSTFPEISACHRGTLNLELDGRLIVARSDYRTPPIRWKPSHIEGEVFDFVRVTLEVPSGGQAHNAWLYIAHRSRHREDPTRHEFISHWIDLKGHTEIGVAITRECLRLPYRHAETYVVI